MDEFDRLLSSIPKYCPSKVLAYHISQHIRQRSRREFRLRIGASILFLIAGGWFCLPKLGPSLLSGYISAGSIPILDAGLQSISNHPISPIDLTLRSANFYQGHLLAPYSNLAWVGLFVMGIGILLALRFVLTRSTWK